MVTQLRELQETYKKKILFVELEKKSKSVVFQDSWRHKIEAAIGGETVDDGSNDVPTEDVSTDETRILTVGTVGHPNVGKSSLINSLMGKRVVSLKTSLKTCSDLKLLFLKVPKLP